MGVCIEGVGSIHLIPTNPKRDLMRSRFVLCLAVVTVGCSSAKPQTPPVPSGTGWPERAVRRDIPLGPQIRKAFAAGTRDSTGAPGAKYWQQKVDYQIEARIDPSSNQLRGSETITLHNTTPDTLKTVVLRLYQNYFSARVERNDYITDLTDGMTIERISVNGSAISLTNERQYELNERIVTINPAAPILPGATATIETAWHFTVPNVDTTERGERMGRFGSYLYQVAQWYPQMAMYDDMRGWDTDQYLGQRRIQQSVRQLRCAASLRPVGGCLVRREICRIPPKSIRSARSTGSLWRCGETRPFMS